MHYIGGESILKLSFIELLFRTLPEVFIVILGIHVISRKTFNILRNLFLCIGLSVIIYLIRMLPIYFGVHMMINLILTISIMAITGIPIIKSIYSTLLVYSMLSLSEFLNMILLNLFSIDTSIEFINPITKCFCGLPSLIILLIFIAIFNFVLKMKEGIKNVSN